MRPTAPTSPRGSRATLWALTATHAANDFFTGAVAALLPFFVLQAGYSYAAVAGITLAATALSSVAQPMFGALADRFGLRWMSLAGLILAGAGVAVSGLLADWYLAVWVAIALSGIGVAAYHPAATMEAREAGGGTSGAMSLFSVGGNVGVALAPTAVVLVVGWFGLPGTTLLIAPAVVLGLVYLLTARRAARATPPAAGDSAPAPATAPSAAPAPLRDDWRSFAWLTVVLAMWSVAYVGTSAFVALYSIDRFDATPELASIALSLFPAAGAVGTLLGGWLADRVGRLRIVRLGYALAALSIVGIVLAPDTEIVVAATTALGFSLFLPFAPQITLSHAYLPNRIGVASGLTLGLTLSLGGLVTPLLGALADHSGIRFVFVAMALLVTAGFGLSFVLGERRDAERPPAAREPAAESAAAAQ